VGKKLGSTAVLAGTTAVLALAVPAIGQDLLGGGSLSYGLESEIRMNDNLGLADPSPGVSTLWDNRFTLGFLSETPVSQFRFDTGATLRASALPGQPLDATLDDPFAMVSYTWDGPNSRLEADASYRKVDLTFADPLLLIEDGTLEDTDLIVDSGSRTTTAASLFFEHGLNDPLGFGVDLDYRGLQYSDTTDPGLFDSRTLSAAAFTRFRFSPVAEGRLTASWEDYDADDADETNRETLGLTAGLTYEFDPITLFEASLGYARITETTNLPSTTVQDGLSGSLGLTRDMRNGAAGLVLESNLGINGRRNTLTASRMVELPTGSLDASLGVTVGPSGTFRPVGSLDYVYDLPRGTITASLNHSLGTNTLGNDVATTGGSVGYRTDINAVSSLSFEADFASVADLGAAPVDRTTLASLRASYSHELTETLDLTGGYEYRVRTETGASRRSSNEIFLVLEYTFDEQP